MNEDIELASQEVCLTIQRVSELEEGKLCYVRTPREQRKLEQHRDACRRWRARVKQAQEENERFKRIFKESQEDPNHVR